MMVGSLEADIQDVQNSIDNRDVIDDFDDDNDERTSYNFHKMEVCIEKKNLYNKNSMNFIII